MLGRVEAALSDMRMLVAVGTNDRWKTEARMERMETSLLAMQPMPDGNHTDHEIEYLQLNRKINHLVKRVKCLQRALTISHSENISY
jgi:hypothetical protein